MQLLAGKVAVVTGATAGIGLAIAERCAREGAYVYLTGRRQDQLDEAVAKIDGQATGVRADSAVPGDLDRLYARIADDGRRLDVVVASAAATGSATVANLTEEHLTQVFQTNLIGTALTVHKALPLLNDGGSVVLIGSAAAERGIPGLGAYGASKAAVRAFARTWAKELSGRGIRVNTVTPGAFMTPGLQRSAPDPEQAEQMYSAMAKGIPLGRLGDPAELANAVVFLASAQGSFITGGNLVVDGGSAQV